MKHAWAVFGLLGLGLVFNLILFFKLQQIHEERALLKSEMRHIRKQLLESEKTNLAVRKAESQHLAAVFQWDNLQTLQGAEAEFWFQNPDIKLLLIFSELSCDVCQDRVTQMAIQLAEFNKEANIAAVVHAGNPRFAETYIRTNGIFFPVYFSENDHFVKTNQIKCVPAVFLVGENGTVLGSHCPIPSQEDSTVLFFKRCEEIFRRKP